MCIAPAQVLDCLRRALNNFSQLFTFPSEYRNNFTG